MSHCTGMLGRLCSCGMWHGDGGRRVNTLTDEAPRARMPITFASDEGTLAEPIPEVNVLARCAQIACLVFAFGCAAAGIHALFFR